MTSTFESLTNDELIFETREAIRIETEATSHVVRLLREIESRELYLLKGFSSLIAFAVDGLGYCAGSAQLRINAMKLIDAVPEVEQKIESGELTLTAASKIQSFFKSEEKVKKLYTQAERVAVVQDCLQKSTREVERELARKNPDILIYETTKPVGEDRFQLTFTITRELEAKIRKLKGLLAHSQPNLTNEALLEALVEMGLEKFDPVRKAERAENRRKSKSESTSAPAFHAHETKTNDRSRYIPSAVRSEVWLRNRGGGCEYVDDQTKRRCCSQQALQIDHIEGFAIGGQNTVENLRLLCAKHNRFVWKLRFKKSKARASVVREEATVYVSELPKLSA